MPANKVTGGYAVLDSGEYYKIGNMRDMPAFFINIAASSDIWIFLSSNGALTAGRQNTDGALFPYETDDRLHLASSTGPKTIVRLADGRIWEPFDRGYDNPYAIKRNIYKRLTGDAVLFEEINESLGIAFSYRWEASERYGLARTSHIRNLSDRSVAFTLLDGVENIIPYGIPQGLSENSSCLTDAYKACERPSGGSLAIYSLTSMIIDKPEPVEVLRANAAWGIGGAEAYLLSSRQIGAFCSGGAVEDERNSVGRKGAYLVYKTIALPPGGEESWLLVMDARLSQKQISELADELNALTGEALRAKVEDDIKRGTDELRRIVAAADGLQQTADKNAVMRHYMNVLYNNMRGGVFLDGYTYDIGLLEHFIVSHNKPLAACRADFMEKLKQSGDNNILRLHETAREDGDPDLTRLCLEFLPLTFSRRHGDPSRPWNRFNIRVKDDSGHRLYSYEGNWRDIFQNWEAMSLSFPGYIAPIAMKFLNASTADGYNPYRVTEDGVDWEAPQPNEPFSGFGYWGDHQIVYLNKLLEWLYAYEPGQLKALMGSGAFVYADVPYEIKPYAELLKDGKNTLTFNFKHQETIMKRVEAVGADGKLMTGRDGICRASFAEKLLIPILAKLSNLVPGGGVWMNTQRPEWNDANNAIVGNGLSMVTVYQLYRHLAFCRKIFSEYEGSGWPVSAEVMDWMNGIAETLAGRGGKTAREFLDQAESAFGIYRAKVYANGFSDKQPLKKSDLLDFLALAIDTLAETIDANRREDGLYNAYNILRLTPGGLTVTPMFLMLEGQTAALGSGRLTPDEALALAESMERSGLYCPGHGTFYLYPVKQLKTFMERNIIPSEAAMSSKLLGKLLDDGAEGLILKDSGGHARFHDSIRQSSDLECALNRLRADSRYAALAGAEADAIREIYELVFAHRQFTGRSGIMYKYEGIGSIYWHQNAKFLLSFQEVFNRAARDGYGRLPALKDMYYRLRAGFGFNREPSEWGAFPLEPYSHTPSGMPAQQPGMTGQVKEEILTRYAELGLNAAGGVLSFSPALLRKSEFFNSPSEFRYIAIGGEKRSLSLEAGELAFTVCQAPVVYRLAPEHKITVYNSADSALFETDGLALNETVSRSLFERDNQISRILVEFTEDMLV